MRDKEKFGHLDVKETLEGRPIDKADIRLLAAAILANSSTINIRKAMEFVDLAYHQPVLVKENPAKDAIDAGDGR